jgi:hypothetical protein
MLDRRIIGCPLSRYRPLSRYGTSDVEPAINLGTS